MFKGQCHHNNIWPLPKITSARDHTHKKWWIPGQHKCLPQDSRFCNDNSLYLSFPLYLQKLLPSWKSADDQYHWLWKNLRLLRHRSAQRWDLSISEHQASTRHPHYLLLHFSFGFFEGKKKLMPPKAIKLLRLILTLITISAVSVPPMPRHWFSSSQHFLFISTYRVRTKLNSFELGTLKILFINRSLR